MDRITLDREVFKALASDTRLDILKALDERQKTVTELARELDLNKATVFEHLEKLALVDLIQKIEDDRKWVYWQLSWKGRRLLHPEKITLALLLSTAMGTLLTALATLTLYLRSSLPTGETAQGAPEGDMRAFDEGAAQSEAQPMLAPEAAADAPAGLAHDPQLLAATIVLGLVVLVLVGWAVVVHRRAKARRAAAA